MFLADKSRDLIGKGTQVEGRRVRELRRTALFWNTRTLLLDKRRKGLNTGLFIFYYFVFFFFFGLFNFNSSAVKELHYDSNKKLSFF